MYKVSVPGSLMLMGEYAVLHSQPAIICAINRRIEILLDPCCDSDCDSKSLRHCEPTGRSNLSQNKKIIKINSALGNLEISLDDIKFSDKNTNNMKKIKPFEYVLAAINIFKDQIPYGFSLNIKSNFSSTVGFGSSAAVTVATVAVIYKWLYKKPIDNYELLNLSKEVILNVAGCGSGADLAASIFGGVILYQGNNIEKLPTVPNLSAIYCGYKTKTKDVISIVDAESKKNPCLYDELYKLMGKCVVNAKERVKNKHWNDFGKLMNVYHELLSAIGVNDYALDDIANKLKEHENVLGTKISGAGLGDCVIALGNLSEKFLKEKILSNHEKSQYFSLKVCECGLNYEKERISCENTS